MNMFVKKITNEKRDEIYTNHKSDLVAQNNNFIDFSFKSEGVTSVVYKPSKKCSSYKIVISGNNIESFYLVKELNKIDFDINVIGSDEVGNGNLFGPIVVTAVKLKDNVDYNFLKEMNIRDSKKISKNSISDIYLKLHRNVHFVSIIITPGEYNDLIKKGYNNKSIYANMHLKAIEKINTNSNEKIVIDKFTSKSNFEKYVNRKTKNYYFYEKAEEKFLQVAIASIISRYKLDEWFTVYYEKTGINLLYGTSKNSKNQLSELDRLGYNKKNLVKLDFKLK